MDFNERAIPGVTSNYLMQEAISRYNFALKYVKNSDHVLDVACGTGYGSSIISKKAKSTLGIDIDSESVGFANKYFASKNLQFKTYDATKMKFDNKFDVVVSFETIEHIKNYKKFLMNISNKCLKKGGTLIISTPNNKSGLSSKKMMSPFHTQEFSGREFKDLLLNYFREVHLYGQKCSPKARSAHNSFMKSQKARQSFVDIDYIGIRKLIPRSVKEKAWAVFGGLFGRSEQNKLSYSDFPVTRSVVNSDYLIAVCKK